MAEWRYGSVHSSFIHCLEISQSGAPAAFLQRNEPRSPLAGRLGGLQYWSGLCRGEDRAQRVAKVAQHRGQQGRVVCSSQCSRRRL
jgi:hypothetical protein